MQSDNVQIGPALGSTKQEATNEGPARTVPGKPMTKLVRRRSTMVLGIDFLNSSAEVLKKIISENVASGITRGGDFPSIRIPTEELSSPQERKGPMGSSPLASPTAR